MEFRGLEVAKVVRRCMEWNVGAGVCDHSGDIYVCCWAIGEVMGVIEIVMDA